MTLYIAIDSLEEPEIIIPDGYDVVSKNTYEMKIDGKKYNQTKIICVNSVDAEANEIRFIEPGKPADTMKLTLN